MYATSVRFVSQHESCTLFLSLRDDDGVVRRTPLSHAARARLPAPSLRSLAALRSPCAPCPRSEKHLRPQGRLQRYRPTDAVALCHHHSRPPSATPSCARPAPPRLCPLAALRARASLPLPAPPLCPRSRAPPPDCTPQPHTATVIISPLLTPSISSGGVRHAGTRQPLPLARAPPRTGTSQHAPARGRSSCARGPLAAG
jgi:hypothetical protein